MLLFQTIIPAVIVFLIFIFGHFFISSSGSGLYVSELNIEIDETLDLAEDVNPMDIDPSTGLILPDKYNYLKIENVFSGKLVGSEKLFKKSEKIALKRVASTVRFWAKKIKKTPGLLIEVIFASVCGAQYLSYVSCFPGHAIY